MESAVASPLVSVVIPVFNRYDCLTVAVASALGQSERDIEVIVVDDGSTPALARSALPEDPRIVLLTHERNRGAAAARNTGIKAAKGDFIAFLDSDDRWEPGKLKAQIALMSRQPEYIGGCITGYRSGDGTIGAVPETGPDLFGRLLLGCALNPGSSLLCRRAVFDEIGLFDENYARLEDWDWLLHFAERYGLAVVPEPLVVIEPSGSGTGASTRAALQRLESVHFARIQRRGWRAAWIFRSSLALERAAILYREHRYALASLRLAQSLLMYPARDRHFARRMLSRARAVLAPARHPGL
jgi:glycosyltransferase involved in cell wall biosynthesis